LNCETPVADVSPVPVSFEQPGRESREIAKRFSVHISGMTVPDCDCELAGIDAGVLHVRSDRQIPESSSIVVSFEHVQLSGVVAECRPAERDWMISVALASCRRRLDDRIVTGQQGVISIVQGDGGAPRPCKIVDASSFGLGLRLSFPIATGARVCVEAESTMVFGEIRHCRPVPDSGTDGEFAAGVLIVDVAPDLRTQNRFSVMLNNLRWKLASSIRGRNIPAYRSHY